MKSIAKTMNLYQQFSHSAIVLPVKSIMETVKFTESNLDFKVDFKWGDPVEYVVGKLGDSTSIHFTQNPTIGQTHCSIYVFVYDVNKVYAQLNTRKLSNENDIGDRDYGMRDFDIYDNNGFRITFGTGLEQLKSKPAD
jgi:hypothetical protein